MTKTLVEMKLWDDGPTVLVESTVSEGSGAFTDAAAGRGLVVKAEKTLSDALSSVAPVADLLLAHLKSIAETPKTAALEFGIKFGAKGNVIIAAGEAEANCKITLTWDIGPQS